MIHSTPLGTKYITEPHADIISETKLSSTAYRGIQDFLVGMDPVFNVYQDDPRGNMTVPEQMVKFAGQLDYMSFGPKRTYNKDAQRYFNHILEEGHGSILEHVSFGILCWGISRSCTHEIVRHRAGFAYSQVSQRYVGENVLRFVERPEFQTDEQLHIGFMANIDSAYQAYTGIINWMETGYEGPLKGTELRKHVRQAARAVLPNCTEAPILITANLRAWRHFLTMRASLYAEPEIRNLALEIWANLKSRVPMLLADYELILDGPAPYLHTEWGKV